MNLITPQEFQNYRNIGNKINEKKAAECIQFAQQIDLYDVLGDFIFDIIDNTENPDYHILLSGDTRQAGIKSLLADYTYARFVQLGNAEFSPFGIVQKQSEHSEPIERNLIKDIVNQSQRDSAIKFKFIDKYLQENRNLFPNYRKHNDLGINTFQQKWTVI